METPLDVLSRAATLIHDQLHKGKDDSKAAGPEPSTGGHQSKELPSRTKKERRRHDRHHELLSRSRRDESRRIDPEEVDRPLDMSTGRRSSPPPYSSYPQRYPSPPDYSSSARPSVITCASSLRSSPAPSCPSPCGSTGSSSNNPPPQQQPPRSHSSPPVQRREIISSGMCDPVIDEHFRRSLGERYTHLFASATSSSSFTSSSSSTASPLAGGKDPAGSRDGVNKLPSTLNVTGLSVDDHFAKALGETWLKLQSDTNKEKEGGGGGGGSVPVRDSSQPGSPSLASSTTAAASAAAAARPGLLLT